MQSTNAGCDSGNDGCKAVEQPDETDNSSAGNASDDEKAVGENEIGEVEPPEFWSRVSPFEVGIVAEECTCPVGDEWHAVQNNRLCICESGSPWHLAKCRIDSCVTSASSSTDRASDYGSEGLGFESLLAR